MKLEVCVDVDDVDRAVGFYGRGLGLTVIDEGEGASVTVRNWCRP